MKVKSLSCVLFFATHGLQPTRLLHPWDFLGKSTGVGCHCLLRYIYYNATINQNYFCLKQLFFKVIQFSSVTQSCLTLCDPMNRSMPGLPVHHQLPEFTQTQVHQVGDAIQPSHPLSSPSPPAPSPSSIRVFSNESTLRMRWPKYWSFSFSISPSKEHSGLISPLEWIGWISLQSKGLSRVFSNTTVQKHQFFSAQLSSQSNFHIHT